MTNFNIQKFPLAARHSHSSLYYTQHKPSRANIAQHLSLESKHIRAWLTQLASPNIGWSTSALNKNTGPTSPRLAGIACVLDSKRAVDQRMIFERRIGTLGHPVQGGVSETPRKANLARSEARAVAVYLRHLAVGGPLAPRDCDHVVRLHHHHVVPRHVLGAILGRVEGKGADAAPNRQHVLWPHLQCSPNTADGHDWEGGGTSVQRRTLRWRESEYAHACSIQSDGETMLSFTSVAVSARRIQLIHIRCNAYVFLCEPSPWGALEPKARTLTTRP